MESKPEILGGGQKVSAEYYPKANLKWPVVIQGGKYSIEGVTLTLNPNQAYIRCANPLRLYEVIEMTLNVPGSDRSIKARAEVVFSNIYGPDDQISPRGMIVRFLEISGDDRKVIAKEAFEHLKSREVDSYKLKALQTIMIDQDEIGSEAA
jgi:hypothetical protein